MGQIQRQTLAALSQSLHSLRSLQEALAIASESVAVADAIEHLQTVLKTVEALRLETGDRSVSGTNPAMQLRLRAFISDNHTPSQQ